MKLARFFDSFCLIVCFHCLIGGNQAQVLLWNALDKLVASQGQVDGQFGRSVALSSDGLVALIGSHHSKHVRLDNAGVAYVYTRLAATEAWHQQALLAAPETEVQETAWFGYSVALSGDGSTALVGAPFQNLDDGKDNDLVDAGAAYLFRRSRDTGSWTAVAKARAGAGDAQRGAQFGVSVALSRDGTVALIGADHAYEGDRTLSGAAFSFRVPPPAAGGELPPQLWLPEQKLEAADVSVSAYFGHDVALSKNGTIALISAYNQFVDGMFDVGAAYFFSRAAADDDGASHGPGSSGVPLDHQWTQVQRVTAGDGKDQEEHAYFATSVALSDDGSVALLGSYKKTVQGTKEAGAAYILARTSADGLWEADSVLTAAQNDIEIGAQLGGCVALSGDGRLALVGASLSDEYTLQDAGAAYLFSRPTPGGTGWTQNFRLTAGDGSDVQENARLGVGCALSSDGSVALLGASLKKEHDIAGAGAAYPICSLSPGCPLKHCASRHDEFDVACNLSLPLSQSTSRPDVSDAGGPMTLSDSSANWPSDHQLLIITKFMATQSKLNGNAFTMSLFLASALICLLACMLVCVIRRRSFSRSAVSFNLSP